MPISRDRRNKVFVSYSHKDIEWLKRLQIHLKDLERHGFIELWDDTKICTGAQWRKEISDALSTASVAILLISADFIASDFIAKNELPPLLAAAQSEGVAILPLIISPSRFEQIESLARFQSVNPASKPLIGLSKVEQEQYLVKLSDDVLHIIKEDLTGENKWRKETRPISGMSRDTGTAPPIQAEHIVRRRSFTGGLIVIAIVVAVAILLAVIKGWFSNGKPDAEIYRVRVTVINSQNVPVEDAKVWSSFGGEPKKVSGGWQFDIPSASKPQGGQLSIFALSEGDSLTGQANVVLGNDYNPAVTVKLMQDETATVRGQVVNGKNQAIAGARVVVVGYESDVVITKENGNFELPAHAAVGQMVTLHAERLGYDPVTQRHPAGRHPATLVMEETP